MICGAFGSTVLVLGFCIYMIRRSSIAEGVANEERDNATYNQTLQEKYAAVSSRPSDSVNSLLNKLRTDGENNKLS